MLESEKSIEGAGGESVKNSMIWAEMARRKKQFHPKESWDTITLWTLHHPSAVKHLVRRALGYNIP